MNTCNPVPEYIHPYFYPITGNKMLELGRKKTKINGEWITYKEWFEAKGIQHTSIDIQGGYGSLSLDLTKPLNLYGFTIVTNLGTSEHVGKQEPCWKNMHDALDVGGTLVSMTPAPGDWWWHGDWYPTEDFYTQFASLNGYRVEMLGIVFEYPRRSVAVRMYKERDVPFTMPDDKLIIRNIRRPRHV